MSVTEYTKYWMKTFKQYLTEMPYLLGNLDSVMADSDIEQRSVAQDARARGKKVGTINGADLYLSLYSMRSVNRSYEFTLVKGDRAVFYVQYNIHHKGIFKKGPLSQYNTVTQSYIELIDKALDPSVVLTIPTKYLTKNRYAIVSDSEHSAGGRFMWIRMMRKFSELGHQVGWYHAVKHQYALKPVDVDYDTWIRYNDYWGVGGDNEFYQYFILPK